ncbi:protein serine/threonine kinase, putative [Entamoeba invadens IP1]|uniref:protein serine/threonine kinase, putative n=1 Tax=Entamoeba invadens IP1 TaxID=370355 RepID=UPI0002C3D8F0|nr:protein serine/threonine kinase, putative [Entamoeba invadens IP1]ELP90449.1 protein serine/threonine kinase, putative [Entamoeba invadens IP1]|eukprot:XP_004257220.1 protein serine/threonine kinase, putative [Entamoeba invadens IP1]
MYIGILMLHPFTLLLVFCAAKTTTDCPTSVESKEFIFEGNCNINTVLAIESSGILRLVQSANLEVTYLNLYNNATLILLENSVLNTSQRMLSELANKITVNDNSKLLIATYVELADNSVFTMNNNSYMSVQSSITATQGASVNLNNFSNVTSSTVVVENVNSQFLITNDSLVTTGNIKINNGGVLTVNERGKITSKASLTLYKGTILFKDRAVIEIKNNLYAQEDSTMTISNNVNIVTNEMAATFSSIININDESFVTIKSVFIVSKSFFNIDGPKPILKGKITEFYCETSTQEFTGLSWLEVGSLNLEANCISKINGRTYKDPPLFIVDNLVSIGFNFTSINEFTIATSKQPMEITVPSGYNLLMGGRLLRYGKGQKVYCHLNGTKVAYGNFIEDFCPCSGEDCYVAPFEAIKSVTVTILKAQHMEKEVQQQKVKHLSFKKHQKVDFQRTKIRTQTIKTSIEEDNVVVINNYKLVINSNNFVVFINSDSVETVTVNNLEKSIIIASKSNFEFDGILCKMGVITNNVLSCHEYPPCPTGQRNLVTKKCESCPDINCNLCDETKSSKCVMCRDGFLNNNGMCVEDKFCMKTDGNDCFKCTEEKSLVSKRCEDPKEKCKDFVNQENVCQFCVPQNNVINVNGKCTDVSINTLSYSNSFIISCNEGHFSNGTTCQKCSDVFKNSILCNSNNPTKCDKLYTMSANKKCEKNTCQYPENTQMDQNGVCSPAIANCTFVSNGKCLSCTENHILTSSTQCTYHIDDTCAIQNSYGCVRCILQNYSDDSGKCQLCDSNCITCVYNSSFCITCQNGYFMNEHRCVPNKELEESCSVFSVTGNGCYQCKSGYYRLGLNCLRCSEKCSTCVNAENCVSCNTTNFLTNDGDCIPQSSIIGCALNVTQNGCSKCSDSFYKYKENQCAKCHTNCTLCSEENYCTSCINDYILEKGSCGLFSEREKCLKSNNSKCIECKFWYTPSEDGTYCASQVVWWVILIIVVFIIVLLIVVITVVYFVLNSISKLIREKSVEKKFTLFKMKKSNIQFERIKGGVCVNFKEINFTSDIGDLPILEESRQLICIGNETERTLKIQFSKCGDERCKIRCNPEIVSLKKGFACEFEVFVTPNFTCVFENKILIISQSLKTGEETYNEITIKGETVLSTRLDPTEIRNEKKLGEGGFGIVYRGKYRGNCVAIKRMKNYDDNNSLTEFEKEVQMLDKFRSEYVVHFYGAVFVPTQMCMVTEFAKFGSLQDLIKKKKSSDISKILRVRFCLNAAKGIQYLHSNGILHRDIKPDNILVFSLEANQSIIAKLTDFGSSRNVNMLMTNMTFTKGVGTPIYMAPEMLNKKKYKKAADIYSFSITMFECFGWREAYPTAQFKYSWDVADFVACGNRLSKPSDVDEKLFAIIQQAWIHNPKERANIDQIIEMIESVYL